MIGHAGQTCQHLAQVSVGIKASAAAAFDDGVEDGSTVSGSGFADEEPVLFAQGRGANGVLDQIIVDLHPAVGQIHFQRLPLAQGIVQGDAHETLWQMSWAALEPKESPFQALGSPPAIRWS